MVRRPALPPSSPGAPSPRPSLVRFALLAGALGLLANLACSSQPAAKTAAEGAPPPAAEAAKSDAETPAAEESYGALVPPDGKWLVDDGGRQYFLSPYPKDKPYRRLDDERIQVAFGMILTVVDQDDENFYFKVYKPEPPPAPTGLPEISAADRAAIEATYRPEVDREADRLRFVPFDAGLPTAGQWRHSLAVADMNGDGHPDIAHGPARKGRSLPVIFLGDGEGHWSEWSQAEFPRLGYDYGSIAVADFNGDGRLDMVLGMHMRGILVLVGDGDGKFTPWTQGIDLEDPGRGTGTAFSSRAVAAADWNGDGRPDVIALGEGFKGIQMLKRTGKMALDQSAKGILVYLNNGDGTWTKGEATAPSGAFGNDIALGDFNGDGRPDAAVGSSVMGSKEILDLGAGDGSWTPADLPAVRPDAGVGAVAAADFDGDGRSDLAVGYVTSELGEWRTGLDLMLSGADGTWRRRTLAVDEGDSLNVSAVAFGDLDGDGRRDLVALTGSGKAWVFLGDGKGWLTREAAPELEQPLNSGCAGQGLRLADLDGDGADEVVVGFAGEQAGVPGILSMPGCPDGGSLRVWKAVPAR